MAGEELAHIGVLVADVDSAREHWSRALGMAFSPVSRYRPDNWVDHSSDQPHLHDARLTFCIGDNPSIEILEFVGDGTHAASRGEGGHHIAFPPIADNEGKRRQLERLRVLPDGQIRHEGRLIFMFTGVFPLLWTADQAANS